MAVGQAIFRHFRILASHWLTRLDPCWLAQGLAGGGGAQSLQRSHWENFSNLRDLNKLNIDKIR